MALQMFFASLQQYHHRRGAGGRALARCLWLPKLVGYLQQSVPCREGSEHTECKRVACIPSARHTCTTSITYLLLFESWALLTKLLLTLEHVPRTRPSGHKTGSEEAVGGEEGGGDPKTPGGSDAGPDALTLDDSESRASLQRPVNRPSWTCVQSCLDPVNRGLLSVTQESAANKWKDASTEAANKWKTTAQAVGKGSSQESTPQVSDAKLTAAAKAGAKANNDALMTLVKTEVASQVLQLKTDLETRLTEMESSAKADLETRFGSLFTNIQCGLTNACEYISGVVKENGRQLGESISGSKRGATSKTPSPKRR
ncbi:unnamed protein product, partial [Ectocarpus fasciculatus]